MRWSHSGERKARTRPAVSAARRPAASPPEEQSQRFPLPDKQARGEFDITQFDREDMVIVGTPEECLEKLLEYEEAGIDQVPVLRHFGYLPQEAVLS